MLGSSTCPATSHDEIWTSAAQWLLQGDSSIRWQAMRDLADATSAAIEKERARVATQGWGRQLLDLQREDGHWGLGAYQPKWTGTTFTMQLLWQMGMPKGHPSVLAACRGLVDQGLEHDGGINFWRDSRSMGETCVTGMVFGQLCAFGWNDDRRERLLDYLLHEQMPDGGWNCRKPTGATHSSFHTTIDVLEALHEYVSCEGVRAELAQRAQRAGREFLLAHRLFKSSTTGQLVKPDLVRLHFPPHWHFDVLRALDYFRGADAPIDERLSDGIEVLRASRGADGCWGLASSFRGAYHFRMERDGEPSRWNTLRAMRVLRWWENNRRAAR